MDVCEAHAALVGKLDEAQRSLSAIQGALLGVLDKPDQPSVLSRLGTLERDLKRVADSSTWVKRTIWSAVIAALVSAIIGGLVLAKSGCVSVSGPDEPAMERQE